MTKAAALAMIVVTVSAVALVAFVRGWAQTRLVDVPNERSSHTQPTPRGGGIGIVLAFLGGVLWLAWTGRIDAMLALAMVLAGGMVAVTGFLDDRHTLPALPRLAVQVASALLGVWIVGGVGELPIGELVWSPGTAGFVIAVFGIAWLINLINFMDGIDGLVGSHTVFVGVTGAALLWLGGASGPGLMMMFLALAAAGFLAFNWPPASIFMGDVASGFLGLVMGLVAIDTAETVNLWAWGTLMGPFIADATVTRAMRGLREGDWVGAHRSHVYQRLSRAWHGHAPVVHAYWLLALVVILPLAIAAAYLPSLGWLIMGGSWLVLFAGAFLLGAGRD